MFTLKRLLATVCLFSDELEDELFFIKHSRWVAAPLGVVAPPPEQKATALFGCVMMYH